jgi:putative transposase
MQLRYKCRLYPGPGHRQAFARAFGCVRVVINDGQLSARLTAAKATPERAWLGEVSAVVLQQGLADLNAAYRPALPPTSDGS